jgi:8-oxo-dGTP pyrophosphatase MutT (NUDIX family)
MPPFEGGAVSRTDYFRDPGAPEPNSLVPAVSAVVADDEGRILLHRRSDNVKWSIPGGRVELGESVADAAVREVREETGIEVAPVSLVGVYSDPRSVVAYDDGEVRQQFSICLACRRVGGSVSASSDESLEVRFVAPDEIAELEVSPAIQLRIDDYLAGGPAVLR